jgi:macrolide-specific efflux system membrane fusion protein
MGQMISLLSKISKIKLMRKKLAIILIVGAAFFFAIFLIFGQKQKQPQYQTAKVQKGTIIVSANASGKVLTGNVINVTTAASGVVKKVYVKDGEKVFAGKKIAEIALDQQGQQKYASSWSSYLSAKNNLESALTNLYTLQSAMFAANQKFIKDAVARNLASDDPTYIQQNADWLAAEAKYKNQQLVIEQARAAVNSAQLAYQQASPVITAPAAGVISNIGLVEGMVLTGQAAGSSDPSSASSFRVAVIQNEAKPLISVNLTEIDAPKVKIGQKATVTFDSLPDKTFTGKVVTVDKIGTTSSNVTNYPALIQLDTNAEEILPNMAANVSIIVDSKSDVLLVPSSAVQNQGGQSMIRVLRKGQIQQVPVQIGLSSDSQTEVISGLSEGDEVITGTLGTTQTQQGGRSIFGGGGFGGGAFRPGGFGAGGGFRLGPQR